MAVSDNTSTTYMLDNRLSGYALYQGYSLDSGYTNRGTSYSTGATSYFKIKDSYGNDVTHLFYFDINHNYAVNYMLMIDGSFVWHMVPNSTQDETVTFYKHDSNSIGNIPMGELTFNGVQSVTYNGTDYTKLVVDGTSYPPLPVIISFTIDGTSYQAEEGMTWAEWVASSYNTGDFIISESSGSPTNVNYYLIKTSSYGFLQATDAIISGEAYIVSKKEK